MEDDSSTLSFVAMLPNARFSELHDRVVDGTVDQVWPHCLHVTAREIRVLGPLMMIRALPAILRRKRAPIPGAAASLLDAFIDEGFVLLRRDEAAVDGRASIYFGAAGKFWSIAHNAPVRFESAAEFLDFDTPGYAKTIARLDAIDLGNGTTRVETETLVHGTDAASTKKFAPYWFVIRLGSGAIRRSWLAAIARRARR